MAKLKAADVFGQSTPGSELTEFQRGMIDGYRIAGVTSTEAAQKSNISASTVRSTWSRNKIREHGKSLPRTGRPKKRNSAIDKCVIQYKRQNPQASYIQIITDCKLDFGESLVAKILGETGICTQRRAKKQGSRRAPAKKD